MRDLDGLRRALDVVVVRELVVLVVNELQVVREGGLQLAEAVAHSIREHARGSKFALSAVAVKSRLVIEQIWIHQHHRWSNQVLSIIGVLLRRVALQSVDKGLL